MFRLHIYNPEHDIALARDDVFFTPPRAARTTRAAFGHLPALWAADGDWILVDDVEHAERKLAEERMARGIPAASVKFVTINDLRSLKEDEMPCSVEPWGWDGSVVRQLLRANELFAPLVPTDAQLEEIRRMSSREFAAKEILPRLVARDDRLVGESRAFRGSVEELQAIVDSMGLAVLKSPWSCSGRGVRFVSGNMSQSERGWARRILAEQGAVMIEPQYEKVLDFAMEFAASADGVKYVGLSIFETNRGVYLRNLPDTEENNKAMLVSYLPQQVFEDIRARIVELASSLFFGRYSGPFGIDMMIVRTGDGEMKVHPCVEMNLRRTMGHAAIIG